ncbi:hypothetical protein [Changchengzhania lutea]|uniref:hypothetical protein n=1 Tax=Changchengzhania lutea TaxID=2049305 RepID=UPI00115D8C69|nr:hypothetical protein [Changchengzhania lutea]
MKTQLFKNWKFLLSIMIIILFFSCEKSDDLINNDVTGTYIGTLTTDLSLSNNRSSETTKAQPIPATVVVSEVGNQIQVYCFAEDFETTIILDTYDHYENVKVCLTGEAFENMYGHMLGQGHMNGNMQHNGTGWMEHLSDEHQEDDEHFGSFDMQHHSFNYLFRMDDRDFYFEGIKK